MTKHTPGPWIVSRQSQSTILKAITIRGGGDRIARVVVPIATQSISECESNARLIAAAPDLLEACQMFAEWLRREDSGFDHKTHDRKTPEGEAAWRDWFYENLRICSLAQEQARAAINKATGEQA